MSCLDDPDAVQAFLDFIPKRMEAYEQSCVQSAGVEDEVENSQKTQEDVQQETEATESATKDESEVDASKKDVDGTSPVHNSATITPAEGHRAPPPTPASLAAAIENGTTHLEAVPEDEPMVLTGPSSPMKAESLDATSGNSKPTNKLDVDIKDEAKLTSDLDVAPNHALTSGKVVSPTSATISAFDVFTEKNGNQGLLASKFASNWSAPVKSIAQRPRQQATQNKTVPVSTKSEATPKPSLLSASKSEDYQASVVERFRKEHEVMFQPEPAKDVDASEEEKKLENANVEEPVDVKNAQDQEKDDQFREVEEAEGSPDSNETTAVNIETATTTAQTDVNATEPSTAEDGQDREHATYFVKWGNPEARSGPRAEIRRVLLKGLPALADNSLVAALVHGGSIETYRILQATDGIRPVDATITFTSGRAAKLYYDKYPNGIKFQFRNKKHVAEVYMGELVDVMSGVMRGYLESGASRVVRAIGADEDWGPIALRKLAMGRSRKLEGIVDRYSDEGRKIDFRFTNIGDAVAFRGQLVREIDWEDCSIVFGDDPCAKAVGVHYD